MYPVGGRRFTQLANLLLILCFAVVTESRGLQRWKKERITWTLDDKYDLLTSKQYKMIRKLIVNAFYEWSSALEGLLEIEEFVENDEDDKADIVIRFASKDHDCFEEFDGRGGVVAHSTYPSYGMLHLDADELWHTGDTSRGDVDLRYVLIHEIGHVLGLKHSKFKGSVMRRHYRTTSQHFQLSKYDVRAIRKLYSLNDISI